MTNPSRENSTDAIGAEDQHRTEIPGAPPSPAELGNSGWNILHSAGAVYPYEPTDEQKDAMEKFLYGFSFAYACNWCAYHMRTYLKENPPIVTDKHALSTYLCRFHNRVNEHLKKPEYDCDDIDGLLKRWHPGYPDKMQDRPSWESRIEEEKKKMRRAAEAEQHSAAAATGEALPQATVEGTIDSNQKSANAEPQDSSAVPEKSVQLNESSPLSDCRSEAVCIVDPPASTSSFSPANFFSSWWLGSPPVESAAKRENESDGGREEGAKLVNEAAVVAAPMPNSVDTVLLSVLPSPLSEQVKARETVPVTSSSCTEEAVPQSTLFPWAPWGLSGWWGKENSVNEGLKSDAASGGPAITKNASMADLSSVANTTKLLIGDYEKYLTPLHDAYVAAEQKLHESLLTRDEDLKKSMAAELARRKEEIEVLTDKYTTAVGKELENFLLDHKEHATQLEKHLKQVFEEGQTALEAKVNSLNLPEEAKDFMANVREHLQRLLTPSLSAEAVPQSVGQVEQRGKDDADTPEKSFSSNVPKPRAIIHSEGYLPTAIHTKESASTNVSSEDHLQSRMEDPTSGKISSMEDIDLVELMRRLNSCEIYCPEKDLMNATPLYPKKTQ